MHCKSCEYPLWNITAPASGSDRLCPECGTPFKPSDYRFTPNSVRFCCPSCKLAYYGTTPEGMLEPAAFACVRCGERCTTDRMILLPGEGVPEHITRGGIFPWHDESQFKTLRGRLRAWFGTWSAVAFTPSRAGALLAEAPRVRKAMSFFIIASGLISFLSIGWLFVFISGVDLWRLGIQTDLWTIVRSLGLITLSLLTGPLIMLAFLLINAFITMLLARQFKLKRISYSMVLECQLYSIAGGWLSAIPCAGGYLSVFSVPWVLVCSALMLARRAGLSIFASLVATSSFTIFLLVILGAFVIAAWM